MSAAPSSGPSWVEVSFDCLPLRSVGRLDVPIDASPKFRQRCEAVQAAIRNHGAHNTYFLYNAKCAFRFTNDPARGLVQFRFEGVVATDADDLKAVASHLKIELANETCRWLTEPAVKWLEQSVVHAVEAEFDRYIAAGDLDRTKQRIEQQRSKSDSQGGFVGMYL